MRDPLRWTRSAGIHDPRRELKRGTFLLLAAVGLRLIVFSPVYWDALAAAFNVGLLAAVAIGGVGFVLAYRGRRALGPDESLRMRLAAFAFLASVVMGALWIALILGLVAGIGSYPSGSYEYLGWLSSLAVGLVLYWLTQAITPASVHPLGLVALLLGVSSGAGVYPTVGYVFASFLGMVSMVLWLLVFVDGYLRVSRIGSTASPV